MHVAVQAAVSFATMADLAKQLLSQFYGFGEDSCRKRFPIVYSSEENSKCEKWEGIDRETRGVTNDEDSSVRGETQDSSDSSEEYDRSSESSEKSPVSIAIDSSEDINKYSSISDIDLGPNIIRNASAILPPSANKDLAVNKIGISTSKTLLEPQEHVDGNIENLTVIDDGIADSISDVSSIAIESRKSRKSVISCATPLPTTPKKEPNYNNTYVDLSTTDLSFFPADILENFSMIRMLYLDNNQLECLPDEIFPMLQHLEWLDVRNNRITDLPVTIKSHPCLESLLLQGNNIETLPLELCTLRKLKTLHVAHNPLLIPPREIAIMGVSVIMEFLRNEWNKVHLEEPVEIDEKDTQPKLSTILCYEASSKSRRNSKAFGSRSSFRASKKALTREGGNRNNRSINRFDATKEQRLLYMSKLREILNRQTLILQKTKDENVRKEWRRDTRSFNKAMEKAMGRTEDDIPFGIDAAEYASIFKEASKSKKLATKTKKSLTFVPPANIDDRISEVLECVKRLQMSKSQEILSPRIKQKIVKNEMNKLMELQQEIQFLKKFSDLVMK